MFSLNELDAIIQMGGFFFIIAKNIKIKKLKVKISRTQLATENHLKLSCLLIEKYINR